MRRTLFLVAVVSVLAGCGDTPTAVSPVRSPMRPAYNDGVGDGAGDNGLLGGSGNASVQNNESAAADVATTDSTSTGRNGLLGGSGN